MSQISRLLRQYGFLGACRLLKDLLLTKLFFKSARLVKFPIDIRNKASMRIGKGFSTGKLCRLEAYPLKYSEIVLDIGDNFKINDYVHIAAGSSIIIGDNVLVASNVFISDISHGSYNGNDEDDPADSIVDLRKLSTKPVKIGANTWIGQNVLILPGVSIGENCIIGAGSVVVKAIPANSIAVGNPARVVKNYNNVTRRWCKTSE
ncbi:MAG: acetyltransferase [Neisseriaceae bacterium]|nr:MAG: acetyltransferase [Neisseriaceae bacterium]